MRVRIRTKAYDLEFEGSPGLWNEFFRPVMGGPEAPPEPDPVPEPVPQRAVVAPRSAITAAGPGAPSPATYRATTNHSEHVPPGRAAPPPRARARHDERDGLGRRDDGPRRGGPPRKIKQQPAPPVEASSDPAVLYRRLAAIGGRRGEKDAVIAAVWFVSGGRSRDVTAEDVERHLRSHGLPAEIKVRPHLLKHVSRTKLLDAGSDQGAVRLNNKGLKYVKQRLVEA